MNIEELIEENEIVDKFMSWVDHYSKAGDKHIRGESEERIIEMYYDRITDRVLEDYPEELHENVINVMHRLF